MNDDPQPAESAVPDTKVTDSDPSGDGPGGLAGGIGVSSERTGHLAGTEGEATHGARELFPDVDTDEDPAPEQSAGGPEAHPDNDVPPHPFDPSTAQGHSHG